MRIYRLIALKQLWFPKSITIPTVISIEMFVYLWCMKECVMFMVSCLYIKSSEVTVCAAGSSSHPVIRAQLTRWSGSFLIGQSKLKLWSRSASFKTPFFPSPLAAAWSTFVTLGCSVSPWSRRCAWSPALERWLSPCFGLWRHTWPIRT